MVLKYWPLWDTRCNTCRRGTLPVTTRCQLRPDKKLLQHFCSREPDIPKLQTWDDRMWWDTRSKAFKKSRNTTFTCWPWSRAFAQLWSSEQELRYTRSPFHISVLPFRQARKDVFIDYIMSQYLLTFTRNGQQGNRPIIYNKLAGI